MKLQSGLRISSLDKKKDKKKQNISLSSNVLIAYFSRKGSNYVSDDIKNLSEGNISVISYKIYCA